MNEVLTQLHARKSVRVFTDRPVEQDVKRAVLESALQAPTAGNMSLFTILDITDPEIKAALAKSCDNQPFIGKAPLVLEAYGLSPEKIAECAKKAISLKK